MSFLTDIVNEFILKNNMFNFFKKRFIILIATLDGSKKAQIIIKHFAWNNNNNPYKGLNSLEQSQPNWIGLNSLHFSKEQIDRTRNLIKQIELNNLNKYNILTPTAIMSPNGNIYLDIKYFDFDKFGYFLDLILQVPPSLEDKLLYSYLEIEDKSVNTKGKKLKKIFNKINEIFNVNLKNKTEIYSNLKSIQDREDKLIQIKGTIEDKNLCKFLNSYRYKKPFCKYTASRIEDIEIGKIKTLLINQLEDNDELLEDDIDERERN